MEEFFDYGEYAGYYHSAMSPLVSLVWRAQTDDENDGTTYDETIGARYLM